MPLISTPANRLRVIAVVLQWKVSHDVRAVVPAEHVGPSRGQHTSPHTQAKGFALSKPEYHKTVEQSV